ncbi:hypothetical protein BpHYR1_007623 [Brachionus plicatilis]|uniref:Uncharacterized protein n=1 Tax=Brachionus plicatilis TaxID=10195 RepID=A0A3M7RCN0_BRAPC|nr:hypothetical protein BpHYR1_007623 [Brachionus plicatilis]
MLNEKICAKKQIIISVLLILIEGANSAIYISEIITTQINKLARNGEKLKCATHFNCSIKILTLDSYCCGPNGFCCSWFEYILDSPSNTNDYSVQYKPPTLSTIIVLLIILVCMLLICYCFIIFLCFRFKCGLFKKPNLIVISEASDSSIYESDCVSAQLFSSKNQSLKSHQTSSNQLSKNFIQKNQNQNLRSSISMSYCPSPQILAHSSSSNFNFKSDRHFDNEKESPSSIHSRMNKKNKRQNKMDTQNRTKSCDFSQYYPFLNDPNELDENFDDNNLQLPSESSSLNIENTGDGIQANNSNHCGKESLNFYADEKPPSYYDIIKRKN